MDSKPVTKTTFHDIDGLAAIIHDAKIRSCWMKSQWAERRAKEPWGDERHAGSPNQPWHDVATDQAKAVLEFLGEESEPEYVKLAREVML